MSDYAEFLEWLEDHNYKVVHCCHCMKWKTYYDGFGYCSENEKVKHYDDWCSDAAEEAKERIMMIGALMLLKKRKKGL